MSLKLLAKQMEAKGRKGDSMLVHMTPGEVAGLQKLAESAGGSLSVNPETGLVEAFSLKEIIPRLFPTIAGVAAGMVGGPVAGAAAGALVGGMQAKQNDQDVLFGAAMGGLGGYGGGSMGAGLSAAGNQAAQAGAMQTALADQAAQQTAQQTIQNTAAQQALQNAGSAEAANMLTLGSDQAAQAAFNLQQQELGAAAINQAAEKAGTDFAAQGLSDRAGQGISALMDQGSNVGRSAFMSKVGGGAGLVSDIGMATAPLMAPGKRPGEAPVDDEMYSYEYNPGRTGAERSPMATTAERRYFDSGYSPMRKIKASQYGMAAGGLLGLAEGGSTGTSSEGMTGASKAAFDYLMGRSEDSGFAGQGSGSRGVGGSFSGGDGMYSFDPATGQFTRNPNYVDPEELERQRKEAEAAAEAARQAAADRERGDREEDERRRQAAAVDPYPYDKRGSNPDFARINPDGSYDYTGVNDGRSYNTPDGPAPATFGPTHRDYGDYGYDNFSSDRVSGYDYSGIDRGAYDSYGGESGGIGASHSDYGDSGYDGNWAQGGLLGLAKGGMKSGGFVIPADVVSMIGEGNTDAGYSRIKSMIPGATAIKGKDGGQADTVKTSIEGKQPARVAHGEMYIPPETVKRMGGAEKLYAMMDRVRQQATGSKKQIKPVSLKRAMA